MKKNECRKLIVLFSHFLTERQKEEIFNVFNITQIIDPPDRVRETMRNIPPVLESIKDSLSFIIDWLKINLSPQDYVLIQGEFGATFLLVDAAFKLGGIPVYSTTKRIHKETREHEQVHIEKIFEHERFRVYERYEGEGDL